MVGGGLSSEGLREAVTGFPHENINVNVNVNVYYAQRG